MMFIKKSIIDTREYVYENRKYKKYPDVNFIKYSQLYFQSILTFIKNEFFTPFEYCGIKEWNISNVNLENGD